MRKDTLIEHKKTIIVCEEIGPINLSYNVLLTTLEANIVVKPIIGSKLSSTKQDEVKAILDAILNFALYFQ
jgi:hypothetical protein